MNHLCSEDIRRHNLKHFVLALVLLSISLLTMTYCWIEGVTAISIVTDDNKKVSIDNTKLSPKVIVDGTASDSINLSQYIDNADYLFLAPAKLEEETDGKSYSLKIKNSNDDSFRSADSNDIGNNYIEFSLQIQVNKNQIVDFTFSEDSKILFNDTSIDDHPIKVAFFIDGEYKNTLGPDFANKPAFSLDGGDSGYTYNLKVLIFADYNNYGSFKGNTVKFNLTLDTKISTPNVKVSVANVQRADIQVKYTDSNNQEQIIQEGNSVDLPIGTKLTLVDITSDDNNKFKGSDSENPTFAHILDKFTVNGSAIDETEYTINNSNELLISAETKVRDFYIGGEGFKDWTGSWDDNNKKMSYDQETNTVSAELVNSQSYSKFKISMDGFNTIPGNNIKYRDSENYSVTLNEPTIDATGDFIIGKNVFLSGNNTDICVSVNAPIGSKFTVVYDLAYNKITVDGIYNYTIYFRNTGNWEKPTAYYWEDQGAEPLEWPGNQMVHVSGNVWKIEVLSNYNRIIFNNGKDDDNKVQTASLAVEGNNYIYDFSNNTWTKYTKTITVGVISYVYNETSSNLNSYLVYYWGGSTTGDASCTNLGTQKSKNVGYWSTAQTFYMFTAEIPADSTGFKFRIGDRWFGEDGNATSQDTVYAFHYGGNKAVYENE